jgi:sugar phosphate isomerase/epimerase
MGRLPRPIMTNIYVSTTCIPGVQPLAARLAAYHSHGLHAIELGQGVTVDEESLARLPAMDGQFLVHNYFPPPPESFVLNLASKDERIRQQSMALVLEALDWTARLNAPFYSVHAGFITDPISFGTSSYIFPTPGSPHEAERAGQRYRAALELALERAGQLGVGLIIENNNVTPELRGKLLLQSTDEFLALFRDLPAPHLGVMLDTGHLNIAAHTLGFDRLEFVDRLAAHIRAFQISDNDGTADWGRPVQAGSWVLDVLRRPEFAGLAVVVEAHFKTIETLSQYVTWLRTEIDNE